MQHFKFENLRIRFLMSRTRHHTLTTDWAAPEQLAIPLYELPCIFDSEVEATEAGWTVTHRGQCAACSILQDLGVYISRNLTDETRRCGLEGTFLGMEQTFYTKNSKLRAKFLVWSTFHFSSRLSTKLIISTYF